MSSGAISFYFLCFITFIGLCWLGLWGCPQYSVYSARLEGESILAHAQSAKEASVAEAKAKMEAAMYQAQADTIRARGIAASNKIIGESLQNNPAYLQWLWIDELKETKNQIIYVPSGSLGMPMLPQATGESSPPLYFKSSHPFM